MVDGSVIAIIPLVTLASVFCKQQQIERERERERGRGGEGECVCVCVSSLNYGVSGHPDKTIVSGCDR